MQAVQRWWVPGLRSGEVHAGRCFIVSWCVPGWGPRVVLALVVMGWGSGEGWLALQGERFLGGWGPTPEIQTGEDFQMPVP